MIVEGALKQSVLANGLSQHALSSSSMQKAESSSDGELTTASRQGEKTTARGYQARQSRADDRPWNLYKADEAVRAVV